MMSYDFPFSFCLTSVYYLFYFSKYRLVMFILTELSSQCLRLLNAFSCYSGSFFLSCTSLSFMLADMNRLFSQIWSQCLDFLSLYILFTFLSFNSLDGCPRSNPKLTASWRVDFFLLLCLLCSYSLFLLNLACTWKQHNHFSWAEVS